MKYRRRRRTPELADAGPRARQSFMESRNQRTKVKMLASQRVGRIRDGGFRQGSTAECTRASCRGESTADGFHKVTGGAYAG